MYRKRKTRRENGTNTRENYCTFSAEIVKSGTIRLTSLLECMFRANSAFSLKGEFAVGFPMHLIKLCPLILMYVVNDCIVVMYIVHSCTVDAAAFGTNIKFVRKLVIPPCKVFQS